ncbi:hypothetical protein [Campylobacter sp.]|nr:hypothetical protein [Campylobacter sp.]
MLLILSQILAQMLKCSLFTFVNGRVLNALNAVANLIRFCS